MATTPQDPKSDDPNARPKPVFHPNPTKYHQSFCQMLVEHGAEGKTFSSFAGVVGVCRDTLYEWAQVHPEFKYAKGVAKSLALNKIEEIGIEAIQGKRKMNTIAFIFMVKNMFPEDYSDTVKIGGDAGGPIRINLGYDPNKYRRKNGSEPSEPAKGKPAKGRKGKTAEGG